MNGIVIVDKPRDWTSHDVVGKLRGIYHERRVGHSGTLDPMATGVLVVFIGRATRAVEFAESHEKEYLAEILFGRKTDTQDITGRTLEESDACPTREQLEEAASRFRGEITQIPPMYSALKVNGKKLYELARQGQQVERKPRKVTISKLEIGPQDGNLYTLDVVCSKGTYIRTVCEDLGDAVQACACMSSLRRIRAGAFTIQDSHSIEEIQEDPEQYLLPLDLLFQEYPETTVTPNQEKVIRNGGKYSTTLQEGTYRFYSQNGDFLMLGRVSDDQVTTIKNFFEVL